MVAGGNNNLSAEEHALIKRLYIAGATQRQIRAITGHAPQTVTRHCHMFRDYIKCEHDVKSYLCKLCRTNTRHGRKSFDQLRKECGISDAGH